MPFVSVGMAVITLNIPPRLTLTAEPQVSHRTKHLRNHWYQFEIANLQADIGTGQQFHSVF